MLFTLRKKKDRNIEITPNIFPTGRGNKLNSDLVVEALLAGLSYAEKSGQLHRFLSLYYDTQKKVQVFNW